MSVSKTLAQLLALPANRSCADCRVTLVDSSQVYASYSPVDLTEMTSFVSSSSSIRSNLAVDNLNPNEEPFAAQGSKSSFSSDNDSDFLEDMEDPALVTRDRNLAHGVFLCAMCGAAHKLLQPGITRVHAVKDPIAWNAKNVDRLVQTGNSHSWKVLEAYIPAHWSKRWRPLSTTRIAERLVFIRAKYEALAFCLPGDERDRILLRRSEWKEFFDIYRASMTNDHPSDDGSSSLSNNMKRPVLKPQVSDVQSEATAETESNFQSKANTPSLISVIPNRLVDFFCVVTAGEQLDPKFQRDNMLSLEHKQSVDEFLLVPTVTDCYPNRNSYSDMEFPEHVGSLVFPEGCRPSSAALSPLFFNFVLTCADGSRLYGGALKLHDDKILDLDGLKQILKNSGYSGKTPSWFDAVGESRGMLSHVKSVHSDIAYLPKCLVVLSHHPFFDLWRKFLLQIYRIALVEAPLPIERFIANFVSEVPLPPPGKIEVRFGFTANEIWTIKRPPDNELPMCDFSFQPLFSTLSVSSIMVILGCLLQETRVALVSKHYALLTPIAEALLSFLFPLHWQGMYIPIVPYAMLDILEAPMPFLIGLHSRYLQDTSPERRPVGVVFVDVDQDVVHLGWNDDDGLLSREPRGTPALPEKDAAKLKNRLIAFASAAYILPDSDKAGTITHGDGDLLPFEERDSYSHLYSSEIPARSSRRKEFFGDADRAYGDNEIHLSPEDFLSGQALLCDKEFTTLQNESKSSSRTILGAFTGSPKHLTGVGEEAGVSDPSASGSLMVGGVHSLEARDPKGFSVPKIRNAFFRFMVGIFKGYRDFIDQDQTFHSKRFLASMNLSPRSQEFLRTVIGTQMFARFIQERIDCPYDPEVILFDVTIDAKKNSFRKAPVKIIMNGGYKDTSFLDDKSKQVKEQYSPPTPSRTGLPEDGRTYHYGSFPQLNPSLFGPVRTPIVWPQYQSKSIRNVRWTSFDLLQKQNSLVSGLFGMTSRSVSLVTATLINAPNTLEKAIWAAPNTLERVIFAAPNTLERAIFALSRPFGGTESDPKAAAETFVVPSDVSINTQQDKEPLNHDVTDPDMRRNASDDTQSSDDEKLLLYNMQSDLECKPEAETILRPGESSVQAPEKSESSADHLTITAIPSDITPTSSDEEFILRPSEVDKNALSESTMSQPLCSDSPEPEDSKSGNESIDAYSVDDERALCDSRQLELESDPKTADNIVISPSIDLAAGTQNSEMSSDTPTVQVSPSDVNVSILESEIVPPSSDTNFESNDRTLAILTIPAPTERPTMIEPEKSVLKAFEAGTDSERTCETTSSTVGCLSTLDSSKSSEPNSTLPTSYNTGTDEKKVSIDGKVVLAGQKATSNGPLKTLGRALYALSHPFGGSELDAETVAESAVFPSSSLSHPSEYSETSAIRVAVREELKELQDHRTLFPTVQNIPPENSKMSSFNNMQDDPTAHNTDEVVLMVRPSKKAPNTLERAFFAISRPFGVVDQGRKPSAEKPTS